MIGAVEDMACRPRVGERTTGTASRGTVVGLDELIAATGQGWDAAAACAACPSPS